MNDVLRRKVLVRKAIYFAVILALFTLSMFWRGVFRLPVGDPERGVKVDPDTNQPLPMRWQDEVARLPIRFKADDLELRELDMGDPEVAGAAAQVSLVGLRGPVVTVLWKTAINKQVRGEYDKMEFYARLVSRLQPHFIEPWIFQAWNISYNVSVETDRLGDQYYYIAKGISFLSEGDRINTKTYRRGGQAYRIGSPDIRYQLGFYYQNKFNVADKVETLRCLANLSCIPPADRDPTKLTVDGKANGLVDPERFLKFCEANPQLVRRMKKADKKVVNGKEVVEGLNLKTPEAVVEFLAVNRGVPARFLPTGAEAPEDLQFPVFPKTDATNPALDGFVKGVLDRTKPTDGVDVMHAARAWFEYAQEVVPPPKYGEPSAVPRPGEYDEFRYRIPQRPALIVFRTSPCRSQTYLAERLQKEGWITADTSWDPDATTDDRWFPGGVGGRTAHPLRAPLNAQAEWKNTYDLWAKFGKANGMDLEHKRRQEDLAAVTVEKGLGPLGGPLAREYSKEELDKLGITPDAMRARQAVVYFEQNRHITNYQYFLDTSLMEMDDQVAQARQLLWEARQLHESGEEAKELAVRVRAAALWRQAIANKHRTFYTTSDRNDTTHDVTLEQEVDLAKLLEGTPEVTRRVAATRLAYGLGGAGAVALAGPSIPRQVAADEATLRIAAAYPSVEVDRRVAELMQEAERVGAKPDRDVTRRGVIEREFPWMKTSMDPTETSPWVRMSVRMAYLAKIGEIKPIQPPADGPPPDQPPTR